MRERHNERKNECYKNENVLLERKEMNVFYKECDSTYTDYFDKLCADGEISTRGLKTDANVFDEMVFDVNSTYFEENGGYEYAKKFFKDVYDFAKKEVGNEKFIVSAVMHADEINTDLTNKLGKDVYHYHLHVVYIPVVEKVIKWTKRCKDKHLVGKIKEIIKQVSHSKKWSSEKMKDENGNLVLGKNGKAKIIPSYSLLQDRYFEYMKNCGYNDVERGEKGSTDTHLTDIEFKVMKEKEKLIDVEMEVSNKSETLLEVDDELKSKSQELETVENKISVKDKELTLTSNQLYDETEKFKRASKNIKSKYVNIDRVSGIKIREAMLEKGKILVDKKDFLYLRSAAINYFNDVTEFTVGNEIKLLKDELSELYKIKNNLEFELDSKDRIISKNNRHVNEHESAYNDLNKEYNQLLKKNRQCEQFIEKQGLFNIFEADLIAQKKKNERSMER